MNMIKNKIVLFIIGLILVQIIPLHAVTPKQREAAINAYNQAVDWVNNDECDRALPFLKKAVRLDPEEITFRQAFAHCLFEMEQYRAAQSECEWILHRQPDNHQALYQMGIIYSEHYQNLEQSLYYYHQAAQLDPKNDQYQKALGFVYERLGRYDDARSAYQKAGTLKEDDWTNQRLDVTNNMAYRITYKIHLKNISETNISKFHLWVAVAKSFPPYQYTELSRVEPLYTELQQDIVGNLIAYFQLSDLTAGAEKEIVFTYRTQVFPMTFDEKLLHWKIDDYAPDDPIVTYYLQTEELVESDHPEIRAKARKLTYASGNQLNGSLQKMYDFVRTNLPYIETEKAKGALYALQGGKECDCNEFSMLFTALNRARGIPTRLVHGYLYNPNRERNIAHAWTEVYTPDGYWIPIDPTSGRDRPQQYFAKINSRQVAMWIPSRVLQGGDFLFITEYLNRDEPPKIESSSSYHLERIDLWYDPYVNIEDGDSTLSVITSVEDMLKQKTTQKYTSLNKMIIWLIILAFLPILIVLGLKIRELLT